MKTFTTILFLLVYSVTFSQVNKTLVKSVAISTTTSFSNQAHVTLPGDAVISEWENEFIRITTNLKVENMNEAIVNQLVMLGRYTIEAEINEVNNTLTILMPKISNKVTVKGVELSEIIEFEINVPKGYVLNYKSTTQTEKQNSGFNQAM